MIISRTPLRMSFSGGGSDLPVFYKKYGGAVLSTSINKYIYVNINKKFDDGVRVAYSKNEEVTHAEEIEHPIVRAVLNFLKVPGGVEITTIADIPARGTGLGSSSSFTVGLLHALHAYKGQYVSRERLAVDSCNIEIDHCGEPIGKQDQYAAAYGGLNLIEFAPDGFVKVSPIICQRQTRETIEKSLLVFYTGITRRASPLLRRQSEELSSQKKKQAVLRKMVKLTYTLRDELQRNNPSLLGEILHEGWMLKKGLTEGISTTQIDDWYQKARRAGALGGKILGAGAGGFLLIFSPQDRQASIIHALSPLRVVPVGFEHLGSRIIFYNGEES